MPSEFFAPTTTPVAKKDHRCIWCGESIPTGEKHHKQFGRFDGEIQTNRYHDECYGAMTTSDDVIDDGCFTPYENERPGAKYVDC
jgi:hypothetical protein